MRNIRLLTGVALITLLSGVSGASADSLTVNADDDIRQITINNRIVANVGVNAHRSLEGRGISSSVGASGAVSSVSASNIADASQGKVDVEVNAGDDIRQFTLNNAPVFNAGAILTGPVKGRGSSFSVSAVGAASVVSVSSIK